MINVNLNTTLFIWLYIVRIFATYTVFDSTHRLLLNRRIAIESFWRIYVSCVITWSSSPTLHDFFCVTQLLMWCMRPVHSCQKFLSWCFWCMRGILQLSIFYICPTSPFVHGGALSQHLLTIRWICWERHFVRIIFVPRRFFHIYT